MSDILLVVLIALVVLTGGILFFCLARIRREQRASQTAETQTRQAALEAQRAVVTEALSQTRQELLSGVIQSTRSVGDLLSDGQSRFSARQDTRLEELRQSMAIHFEQLRKMTVESLSQIDTRLTEGRRQSEQKLEDMRRQMEEKLELMRTTQETRLQALQQDNNASLEKMRITVDEKLQKTLEERIGRSFQLVSTRLEEVYKGLGEMQTLAVGVGDLKRVLSNVKTRGTLGEMQLGAILEQILSPEQYERDVCVVPGTAVRVEYAIKMPSDGVQPLFLPIDSKFPSDTYEHLMAAYESDNPEEIKKAGDLLSSTLKQMARGVQEKYIAPPHTTDFGILFLPTEGLYAEAVRRGMIEALWQNYHIILAGPTTMAAQLSSLQMGFRTLALQQRSGEVWQVLGAVKTEFSKFQALLIQTQKRIEQAGSDLDALVGVRTRAIERRLRSVERLDEPEAAGLLNDE